MNEEEAMLHSLQRMIDDLRIYAKGMLRRTSPELTLQATDLVNMAWLKLNGHGPVNMENPKDIFGLYVTAMKSQLRDYLRTRRRKKRGGAERQRESLEFLQQLADADVDGLEFIDQLDELAAMGEDRQAAIVAGRIFYGLTNAELAEQLGVSVKTVEEDLRKAKAWLRNQREQQSGSADKQETGRH
jgi:RNA polymerase sigma factor (TIGR02999 family)